MKNLSILLLFFLASQSVVYPQLKEGSFFIGGGLNGTIESVDYSADNDIYDKNTGDILGFTLSPNVGYFVLENIAVGLSARIGLTDYKSDRFFTDGATSHYTAYTFGYGVGPFFRYYYPINDFAFIGEIKYLWTWEDEEVKESYSNSLFENSKSKIIRNRNLFSSALGIAYFFNKYVSIEGLFKYEIDNNNLSHKYVESEYPIEDYSMEIKLKRLLFVVGLQVYFPAD